MRDAFDNELINILDCGCITSRDTRRAVSRRSDKTFVFPFSAVARFVERPAKTSKGTAFELRRVRTKKSAEIDAGPFALVAKCGENTKTC